MPTHRHTIGQCQCEAYLCCQTNSADYEGPTYWVGGNPYCLHAIEGCEFDELYHFPMLNPKKITINAVAFAAGFRRELI